MGFYDARCMVTGVSLKGADAALVLLQKTTDRYVPISLAIKGNYNRLGSIDGIEEDANTQSVFRYFLENFRKGLFVVDKEGLGNIESLLEDFERNINAYERHAVLKDQSIVFSLIARAVWDNIALGTQPVVEPNRELFERLFAGSPVASEIYVGSLEEVSVQINEFAATESFMRSRGIMWAPTEGGGQDYSEEMQRALEKARLKYADSTIICKALLDYQNEVGDLLTE